MFGTPVFYYVRYCFAFYEAFIGSSVRFSVVLHDLTVKQLNDEEQFYDQKIKEHTTQ
ncbi:hypothetical protein GCM10016272_05140 [Psychrobacter glaciei]|uniref:PAC domain-containing protein n=1 Tax=Psychrobacter glaciei TaxID=619771 RepID=A0ABQ3GMN6_9GAMM|nr:hypothetical protein GCM10016272_05140 [Psychrobacter glaciei]